MRNLIHDPSGRQPTSGNTLSSGYPEGGVTCQEQNYRLHSILVQRPMDDTKHPAQPAPLFLAGHPALDFLNTRMRGNGQLIDVLQRDEDVLYRLRKAVLPVVAESASHFE